MRFVAPAGTVLRAREVLGWLRERGGAREAERLAEAFRARYGLRHAFLVSSASAGMTVLLRALARRDPARREVAMPGYTCYSVAASAVRAGLAVRPLDVAPGTLDVDPAALAAWRADRSLALIGTSLYGLPSDLPALARAARAGGAAFIDDAAQCLDGKVGERWVGTFGDAGLFSFDKGKNVTSLQGGVIACHDDALAALVAAEVAALPATPPATVATMTAKMLAYHVLLRPRLYWVANALVPLGDTPFVLDSPIAQYPPSLAPLVRRQVERIEAITQVRIENARRLRAALDGIGGIHLPDRPGARSVYPRFPVVFEDPARRDRARAALVAAGIGATGSYPKALIDVPQIRPYLAEDVADTPGARRAAAGILTLPTHGYVREPDIARIARILRSL